MKNFRPVPLLIIAVFFSSFLFAQTHYPDYLDGKIMFKIKDNVPIESDEFIAKLPKKSETELTVDINDYPELKSALSSYSITKLERPSYYSKKPVLMRIFRLHFSNFSDVEAIIRDLKELDKIEYAEKMPIYKIDYVPNDPYYSSYGWYLTQVNCEQAWNISMGDNNIKVAIVDNAVFCGHSDLTTYAQRDVADSDNDATPPDDANTDFSWSHGTHCAGLATADIDNSTGMPSLGGDVELIGIKATPDNGQSGSVYYGYDGLQWACQNGAHVVSLSWGGTGYSSSAQTLINNYPNVVFLAAAGNDGVTTTYYPGGYNNVICVGSVDDDDTRSSFSNYNGSSTWVDIASPGGYSNGGLVSTVYTAGGNDYAQMGGTSMATPFAAGLAGLMLSVNSSLSPAEIESCMISSGVTINQSIGPRIDAYNALQCVQSTLNGDPNANFTADNTTIVVGNSVNYTDLSNDGGNTITNWQWTFNGGTPSSYTGQNPPAVTYNTTGTYTVELTVTNSQNTDTETKTDYITVESPPIGAWIEQATAFSNTARGINYISIVDANTVWATAYDGSGNNNNIQEFTKTTDGGSTWTPGTIDVGNTGLGISMIHAISSSTAWLAAYPTGTGQTGGIWKTTDGGSNWTRQNSATYNNASSFTNVVYFWDANDGFCQGDPINGEFELYTTTDGGTNWNLVAGANIPDPQSGEYGYTRQIEVVGDHVWFTTNKGRIFHSSDRGNTFEVFQSPLSDFGGQTESGSISFKNSTEGIIIDNSNNVYTTTDAGANWTTVTTTGTVYNSGVCWIEGTDYIFSTGAATGSSGSSFSDDGGQSWNSIDTEQHTCVEFMDQSTGWSGWFNDSPTTKGIWKWGPTSTLTADFMAAPTTLCVGNSTTFSDLTSVGTPTSWDWSFPGGTPSTSTQQNPTVTYNTAGTYDVTLTVGDGTSTDTKTVTDYITVNDVPAQPSTISGNTAPCEGVVETYDVTLVYGNNYTWSLPSGWTGSSNTNSIDATVGSSGGTITITPSNSCGQGTARTLNVSVTPKPTANFSYVDNLGAVTFTNNSTDATSYYWEFGDGGTSNNSDPSHTYSQTGTYYVVLVAMNSCGADTITDSVDVVTGMMEIGNTILQIYPNPANDIIYISSENNLNLNVSITDIHGRKVLIKDITENKNRNTIDVSGLSKGIYNLQITNYKESINKKIIIN